MKFIHLGDLHIGKSIGEFSLIEDQKYILDQIVALAKERSADAVLISGDVYDRSLPTEAAVALLDDFISALAGSGIPTFIISGNHDSEGRLNYGSRLFAGQGIHIASIFDGTVANYTVEDAFGEVGIYLLPFVKASQVRHFFPDETIESYEDAVRVLIRHAEIDPARRNILLAHQFVTGESDPDIAGSEGASVQNVGTIEKIHWSAFGDFDYVALGHLHSPQRVGADRVRYAGSPLKYSLSEANSSKSVPVVTLREKGDLDVELVPLRPLRDLRHITGRLEQLLSAVTDPQDLLYVTLTDEEPINDAMGILQQYYPNTVKVDFRNSHTLELENYDLAEFSDTKTFDELISDFYQTMYGQEIPEEELRVMLDVAREAGVFHEAD
ncbi:MAG: exonuclease SbcCD subunit D [Mogibacterium sp.]|nr:exonuclease SbcCD subunit D [Mogibacterium sp.]